MEDLINIIKTTKEERPKILDLFATISSHAILHPQGYQNDMNELSETFFIDDLRKVYAQYKRQEKERVFSLHYYSLNHSLYKDNTVFDLDRKVLLNNVEYQIGEVLIVVNILPINKYEFLEYYYSIYN